MKRLPLLLILSSVLGVVFGATTSQASIQQCQQADIPSQECLTQDPLRKRVEGIGMGITVSICAALGATWNIWGSDRH